MTDIYRKFDPQTRRLTMVTPSAAGGVKGDSRALTLHFQYDSTFDISKYNCYITFDVLAYNKMAYSFSATTTPVFDGKTFIVPYEVMSRVRKNTLGYQIAFLEKDSDDPEFTQSQEDHLVVADTIDLKVILDPLPEYWINFFRENALIAPPRFNESTGELIFKTASGREYNLNIGALETEGSGKGQYMKYDHDTYAKVWRIRHDMGKWPQVQVLTYTDPPKHLQGQVTYISENEVQVSFNTPVKGYAILE